MGGDLYVSVQSYNCFQGGANQTLNNSYKTVTQTVTNSYKTVTKTVTPDFCWCPEFVFLRIDVDFRPWVTRGTCLDATPLSAKLGWSIELCGLV